MPNENTDNFEETRSPEAQAIIDAELNENKDDNPNPEDEDNLDLPSDGEKDDEGEESELFAGKYNSVAELKKGITNIGSNLPQYVIDGMSDEALEKHYEELTKTTKSEDRKPRKHAPEKQEKSPDDIADADKDKDGKPIEVNPELWQELDQTFNTTGSITDEQYDKLNAVGIPDAMIDRYLDGINAEKVAFTEKMYGMAGGEAEFNAIKEWAEDHQPDMVRAINGTSDHNQILAMMRGVKADYDASNTKSKDITIRGKPAPKKGGGYTNEADYIADVNDPRYKSDQRFRDKVKAKLSKSNLTEG